MRSTIESEHSVVGEFPHTLSDQEAFKQDIQIVARMVVGSHGRRQTGRDFIDEAPALIFGRIAKFDESKAGTSGVLGWCSTVLRRAWIDRLRRAKANTDALDRAMTGDAADEQPLADIVASERCSSLRQIEIQLSWDEAFSSADRVEIETWTERQTVLLLGLTGLWHKMARHDSTDARWKECLRACEITRFPEEQLEGLMDRSARLQIIADALCVGVETIARQMRRCLSLVSRLEFVRTHFRGLEVGNGMVESD